MEEAEWYGLTLAEALEKLKKEEEIPVVIEPLKTKFRAEFIEQLKEKGVEEPSPSSTKSSWASSLNPFKFNKTV